MPESFEVSRLKQFTMRVSAEEAQQLEELADLTGSSVSELVRKLVRKEHAVQKLRRESWPLQYMQGKLREIVSSLLLADDPSTISHCFTLLFFLRDDGRKIDDDETRQSWERVLTLIEPNAADAKQKGAKEHGTMPFRVARLTYEERAALARELWDVMRYLDGQAFRRSWRFA